MGRTVHETVTKSPKASFCTCLPLSPNFATFLFFLDSQRSQILSAFRHFPHGEMSRHKTFRTTRTANSIGSRKERKGGRKEGRREGGMASKVLLEWTGPRSSATGTFGGFGHACARTYIVPSPTLSGKLSGRGAVRRDDPGNFYHEGPNGSAVHSNYNTATAASSSSISTSQLLTGKCCWL